jgi:hypothetical protein
MPGQTLTMSSSVQCFHGGAVILTTANSRVTVEGALVLLESDVHAVIGCPFTRGSDYSPCVRVEWSGGADLVSAGDPVLVRSSVGTCYSAEDLDQGVAVIGSTQAKVNAR